MAIENEELFSRLFEFAPDAVVVTDEQGVIVRANAQTEQMFGHKRDELLGSPVELLVPDRFSADHVIDRTKYMDDPHIRQMGAGINLFGKRKDGSEFPVDIMLSPVETRRGRWVLTVVRDMTARRQVENALHDSENRLRLFIENAPAAIAMFDREMRYLAVSRRWIEDYGLVGNIDGRSHYDVFPEIPDIWRQAHRRGLSGESVSAQVDRFDRTDGQVRHLCWEIRPWTDASEQVGGILIFTRDISAQVEAEQLLRDADRRKDEFLATLAHELRGPLAPLSNMLQIIKRAEGEDILLRHACDVMERQLGQMVRLIDDLLDVGRISHGKIELKKQRVELASIIDQALETCRPLAEEFRHEFSLCFPPEPIYIDADPVRLAQVISNLLNNACKYTEPNGSVCLSARRDGDEAVIKVKDTGIGIPCDKLDSIFEVFSQVSAAIDRTQGGLGIGLHLVKKLIEMHGGSIEANSEGAGRGSEFVIRLPNLADAPSAPREPTEDEPANAARRRILVVDDNKEAANSLAMLLKFDGRETHTAHDGWEAVVAAEQFRPDVILLDIGLPNMNGYDVCRAIRDQPWGKSIVMVAVTGWGQEKDRQKSTGAGFDKHLVKPIEYNSLVKYLTSISPATSAESESVLSIGAH